MTTKQPNILLILTDEERAQPSYEVDALADFRRTRLPARSRLEAEGRRLSRHYTGATACVPSRATLFTGQYPSLHGVRNTDGLGKSADGPMMKWLDIGGLPTMGHWFRAAGYRTFYRGKWHVSHADLTNVDGTTLMTNDRDGNPIEDAIAAYRQADHLEPYGFSGWIGPEPHGADPANAAVVRDSLFAEQIVDVFDQLGLEGGSGQPWLGVASFLNPHDIVFSGEPWKFFGFPPIPDWVPAVPEAPSQHDSLEDRPACQRGFRDVWPKMLFPQPTDSEYRRLYHFLQALVDESIARILESLERNGLADDTIVVFTSDHGDQLGAHGGLVEKWHVAYEESIRVPFVVRGPGIEPVDGDTPTSHVDLLPTLLGLAGTSVDRLVNELPGHFSEVRPFPGRDLSGALRGIEPIEQHAAPVYFMTEDEISRGDIDRGALSNEPFEAVAPPGCVESVIAEFDGRLWKLNRYYDADERTDEEDWELHDLTSDPFERENKYTVAIDARTALESIMADERAAKRLTPTIAYE
ncbi:MAG: sulfatase-like hydrolase/transferase [Acidimicrobiia bacterium]|nr:sulfatase-like hydrolase/transferase [Acidimicrobiia bacterium]